MLDLETRVRARYAETDRMGVVYYANYFVWMEIGRVEWCRAAGLRYRDMEEGEGVLLAVVEARCRYHAPARYDEEVTIRTSVAKATPRGVEFAYQMRAEDGRRLATGQTRHIFCGRDMKPARLPEKYRPLFGLASPSA